MNAYILRAFSERSFLYLWIGEVFTQVASNIFNFFLILVVFSLTHSNTAVSIAVLTFTVPAIFFGSIAGVYVDHWDKRKVLIYTNLLRALILVAFAFSLHNVYFIYVLAFLFSVLVQFFIPAESPMIPLLVREKYLLAANALFGLVIFGSMLVAYLLSGPLLIALEEFKTALFLAAMLVIGAGFIWLIKPHHHRKEDVRKSMKELNIMRDIKATIRLMSTTKLVFRSLLLLSLSQIIILILATIGPGYAVNVLETSVKTFSILFVAPAALGMVIGAVTLVNVFHTKPKEQVIRTGILISALVMMSLPYAPKVAGELPHVSTFNVIMILAFLLGAANAFVFVPANTILQQKTSEEFRGKIYGFLSTSVGILSLAPILLVGSLADIIGVGAVITGIGAALLTLWISLFFIH